MNVTVEKEKKSDWFQAFAFSKCNLYRYNWGEYAAAFTAYGVTQSFLPKVGAVQVECN
jgi:hypothetical protein